MWYWDYTPSWWQHHKKPLTKKQLQKIQEAYAQAGTITETVKELEAKEQSNTEKTTKALLDMI